MTPPFVQIRKRRLNDYIIGKVNIVGKARLGPTKLNVKRTKLLKVGKLHLQSDAGVTVDDEHIEVVEHFKYLGSLKLADENIVAKSPDPELEWPRKECSMHVVPIWKDSWRNIQRAENETSTLAGVDSSQLWRRRLDSDKSSGIRNQEMFICPKKHKSHYTIT